MVPGLGARPRTVRTVVARCMTARSRRGGIWISSSTWRFCMLGCRGCAAPSMGCGRSACRGRARGRGSRCFQALVLSFAVMTREHDTRIWRVVEHHVRAARDQLDCTGVRRVGMDETSTAKGQDYLSIFADFDVRRVLFATEGRCAQTVERFATDLAEYGGDPEKVSDTSSDMSTAFMRNQPVLADARMTFDHYHLAAKLSDAVDAVRRAELATHPELKHTRWLWLKNWANLSATQRRELPHLMRPSAQLATARALRWREDFQAFHDQHPSYAPEYLRRWCSGAKRSRLQPIKKFVTLVEKHWRGIIACTKTT
jgi:transposase